MNQANSTKLIPYGMTDFPAIIRNNYYYVDKTEYIRQIEQTARFFFFVRPRRFGKSLFLNMLECYYDCKTEKQFDELFGNLYVGKHPTPDRNKYLVLKMSFSSIVSDPKKMEASFNSNCDMIFTDFCLKYADLLPPDTLEMVQQKEVASEKLTAVCLSLRRQGLKMYLILDEYDNFANNVLVNYGNTRYRSLTHGDGFLRNFLKTVKEYTDRVVERMYITGVSPVTMDDLTSGFNIASNQSTNPVFNNMIGFTEAEVRELLEYYRQQGKIIHPVDELISKRQDYNKLRHLILIDKNFGKNASIIQEIITQGETVGRIKESFPAVEIAQTDNFKSLLFYYGMLTIAGTRGPMLQLTIPNQVVREQLYGYLADAYRTAGHMNLDVDELNQLMYGMAYSREWESYFQYIATRLKEQSSIREFMEGEAHVKGFLLSYMGMNSYYITMPEYEMNKGFSDFYLIPNLPQLPDMPYSYAIEVKYCPRDAKDAEVEKLLEDAGIQLAQYVTCPKVQEKKGTTEIIAIALVFRGWDLVKFKQIS